MDRSAHVRWRRTACLCLAALLMLGPLAVAAVGDVPDETQAEAFDHIISLRRKLLKRVTIDRVECRLDVALNRLAAEAGVLIHADWNRLHAKHLKPHRKVKLEAKDEQILGVIESLIRKDGVWLPLTETGLYVLEEDDPGPYVLRSYEMRPVFGPSIPLDPLDVDAVDDGQMMEQVAEMVLDTVGLEKNWIPRGGKRWHLSHRGSRLTLGMTLRMHDDFIRLMAQIISARGIDIYLECRAIELPPAVVAQVLKTHDIEMNDGTAILHPDVTAIFAKFTEKLDPATFTARSQAVTFQDRRRTVFLPRQNVAPPLEKGMRYHGKSPVLRDITLPLVDQPAGRATMRIHDGVTLAATPGMSWDRRYVSLKLNVRYEALLEGDKGKLTHERFARATLAKAVVPDKGTLLVRLPLVERKLVGIRQSLDVLTGGTLHSLVTESLKVERVFDRDLYLFVTPTMIVDSREGQDPPLDPAAPFPW